MADATPRRVGMPTGGIPAGMPSRGEGAPVGSGKRPWDSRQILRALLFLLPVLLVLGALVVYPIFATIVRSFFDRSGDAFVGLDNYKEIWENEGTRTALKNNLIWVVFAPTITTALGLVFAVLAERVRWQTAFKLAVFMPMAISFLAAGVIFRLVYESDPNRGLANAVLTTVNGYVDDSGAYVGARPVESNGFRADASLTTSGTFKAGDVVNFGFVGVPPTELPERAKTAMAPLPASDAVSGSVWLDFKPGGGGRSGVMDEGERGMPGVTVQLVDSTGKTVGKDTTDAFGQWKIDDLAPGATYAVRVDDSAFKEAWGGVNWLGEQLVTASVIAAFVWIWAGFAMIVIGSGLAAIPRDVLEAARVDGANEWQVFRKVTAPLLAPVLLVVLVTLTINVLKVFDLVFIIPPGSVQDDATVIALEMWRVSFGGIQDQGLGSAISVVLFLLVIPAMAVNIKRFKAGN